MMAAPKVVVVLVIRRLPGLLAPERKREPTAAETDVRQSQPGINEVV